MAGGKFSFLGKKIDLPGSKSDDTEAVKTDAERSDHAESGDAKPSAKKKPTTVWGHIVQITPIALTILATALAGMSNSEMTQSMYRRTLAGEYEAKASGQWAYFQAKRIRGTNLEGTVALLRGVQHVRPFDGNEFSADLASSMRLLTKLSAGSTDSAKATWAKYVKWLTDAQSPDQDAEIPRRPRSPEDSRSAATRHRGFSQSDARHTDDGPKALGSGMRRLSKTGPPVVDFEQASRSPKRIPTRSAKPAPPVDQSGEKLRDRQALLAVEAKPLLRATNGDEPTDDRSKAAAALETKLGQFSHERGIQPSWISTPGAIAANRNTIKRSFAELLGIASGPGWLRVGRESPPKPQLFL